MYDKLTNSNLVDTLIKIAHPIGEPSAEHYEILLLAAKRIVSLEAQAKKWEKLANEWESAADAASGCDTPDNLRALLNSL